MERYRRISSRYRYGSGTPASAAASANASAKAAHRTRCSALLTDDIGSLRSARSDVRACFTSDSRPASRASSRCLMRAHTPQCSRQRRLLWASRGAVSRTLTLASEPRKAIGFLHPWGRLRTAPGQAQHGTASRHGCHGHPETRAARPHVSWGRVCSMRCSRSHQFSNSDQANHGARRALGVGMSRP